MKEVNILNRLLFLGKKFDIFETDDSNVVESKIELLELGGYEVDSIYNEADLLGILATRINDNGRESKSISISSDVFSLMINADPTVNKVYLQWMLTIFHNYIKNNDRDSAIRFVSEDLGQANKYIKLYEANKRKALFKELCKSNPILSKISDPTNINQYTSLSQLFDSVDPFIVKEPSVLERVLNKMVENGQALIPIKDRHVTLYIPKTRNASIVLGSYASWCTTHKGNGNFKTYTEKRRPNGSLSSLYVIIDNDFFVGKSKGLYQVHFESGQWHDKSNRTANDEIVGLFNKSEGLKNFFYNELVGLAKMHRGDFSSNKYIKQLKIGGFNSAIFDFMDDRISIIKIIDYEINELPNISNFTNIEQIIMINNKLETIHPSLYELPNLECLSLANNKITEIPKEIGQLKNLIFMNLNGNKIKSVSEKISNLDRSNGGNLITLKIKEGDIGTENYELLKILLPTTEIS